MPPTGQASDVEIGAGYALAPDGYARAQQGSFGRRTGRVDPAGFGGGQRQPFHREECRGWDAIGTAAVYGAQGVEPWPHNAPHGDTLVTAPTAAVRAHGLVFGDRVSGGVGLRLYRTAALIEAAWTDLLPVALLPGLAMTDLARYKDHVTMLFGRAAGAGMRLSRTGNGSVADPLVTGEVGVGGVGYKGQIVVAPAGVR